jgi:hypothetical protein
MEVLIVDERSKEVDIVLEGAYSFTDFMLLLYFLFDQTPRMAIRYYFALLLHLLFELQLKFIAFDLFVLVIVVVQGKFAEGIIDKSCLHHFVEVEGVVQRRNCAFELSTLWRKVDLYLGIDFTVIIARFTKET